MNVIKRNINWVFIHFLQSQELNKTMKDLNNQNTNNATAKADCITFKVLSESISIIILNLFSRLIRNI